MNVHPQNFHDQIDILDFSTLDASTIASKAPWEILIGHMGYQVIFSSK